MTDSPLREASHEFAHRLLALNVAALLVGVLAIAFSIYRTVTHPVAWDYRALVWVVLVPLFVCQVVRVRRFLHAHKG